MNRPIAALLAGLALAACDKQSSGGTDPTKSNNAERYARDRQACQSQVGENMKTRRNIDDSRRDVFNDNQDRFGRSALPDTMEAYGDTKSSDRMLERCLESRGWAQQQKTWWQKIAG